MYRSLCVLAVLFFGVAPQIASAQQFSLNPSVGFQGVPGASGMVATPSLGVNHQTGGGMSIGAGVSLPTFVPPSGPAIPLGVVPSASVNVPVGSGSSINAGISAPPGGVGISVGGAISIP